MKNVGPLLLVSMFRWVIWWHSNHCSNRWCILPLLLLSRFFFNFGFQKFNNDVSCHGFLYGYLVWVFLSFLSLWVYDFTNFENFPALSLYMLFSPTLFLLPFWDSYSIYVGSFINCPRSPWGSVSSFYFSVYFQSVVQIGWILMFYP